MAVAFTVNVTPSVGEWKIVDAYSTDVGTAQTLITAVAGHKIYVKSITINLLATDRWVKIFDGVTLRIGPVEPRSQIWSVRYESPMVFSGNVTVQTESDKEIHITMCYRIYPG